MEKYKVHYLKQFLGHRPSITLKDCVEMIKGLKVEARECYTEDINFTSDNFVEMMMLDNCFIIEYFIRFWKLELREQDHPLLADAYMATMCEDDLRLLEKQLPFFVLDALFNFINSSNKLSLKTLFIIQLLYLRCLSVPDRYLGLVQVSGLNGSQSGPGDLTLGQGWVITIREAVHIEPKRERIEIRICGECRSINILKGVLQSSSRPRGIQQGGAWGGEVRKPTAANTILFKTLTAHAFCTSERDIYILIEKPSISAFEDEATYRVTLVQPQKTCRMRDTVYRGKRLARSRAHLGMRDVPA
ncbi:hypothetical protein Sjap_020145 [Stephania japonica]|uniref:Uncharacterized protein n=1 Tax=Stephania japonica TaxID=461633 RepID=A0AAP0F059_9MAGN